MAQAAASHPATAGFQISTVLKWVAIAALLLVGGRFFIKSALQYSALTPEAYGRYWPYHGWLVAHIVGGSVALLTGPFQFWKGLRNRNITAHRWTGRLYLAGVLVGSVASFYVGMASAYPAFGRSLMAMGAVWLTASALALTAILRRQVAAHREWMIRSYVVTFAFVTFRTIEDLHFLDGVGTPIEGLVIDSWLCWAVPLFVTEIVLQWKKIVGPALAR